MIGCCKQIEQIFSNSIFLETHKEKIQHHFYRAHRRTQIVSNHRIHFITTHDSILQLITLLNNNSFGSYQRNLMLNSDNEFILIERLGDKIITANMETFNNIGSIVQCSQKDNRYIASLFISFQYLTNFEPALIWHHHIQQYQVG